MSQAGCPPTAAEKELRYKFWFEFNRVMDEYKPYDMQLSYVVGRTISKEQFYRAITNPHFMAYLILPPENYQMKVEIALDIATTRIMEYLESVELDATSVDKIFKIQQALLGKVKAYGRLNIEKAVKEVRGGEVEEPVPEETPEAKLARLRAEVERRRAEKAALEAKNDKPPVDLDAV